MGMFKCEQCTFETTSGFRLMHHKTVTHDHGMFPCDPADFLQCSQLFHIPWRNKHQQRKPIYRERGSGGNGVANSLRLCQAYLLEKLGIDYNSWSKSVNANHRDVEINFENAEDFENIKKTKGTKKKKTVSIEEIRKDKEISDDE
jgi:hypothetical protein